MTLTERMAYIKGLCEGLNIDYNTKEGKVLLSLIDVVEEMAQSVSGLENDMDQVFEELDAIDEDLTDVEDALWDEYEDENEYEDWEDDEDDCGCGCGHHHHEEDDEEVYDGDLYEITCPKCGEVVCMDEDMLFSPDCACPNCGTSFEVDFDGVEACDCEEENNEDEE